MVEHVLRAPVAKIVPHRFQHLGRMFVDNYAWLENRDDPDVVAYLEAENAFAREGLRHTESLQEHLFWEMRGRIQEDDVSAPQPRGEYFYYWRLQAGQQYRIFCRKRGSLDAPEEVLVDENALAEGHEYCRLQVFQPSPDHRLLAYSVDFTGAYIFDMYVKDLESGQLVAGPIPNTAWTAGWASDNRTLFYTEFDDSHRPYRLLRHRVGDEPGNEALVHEEPDESLHMRVRRTRSGDYLLLTLASQTISEVHFLPAGLPMGHFRVIHPRQHRVEYYVEHHGDRFLILTNDGAENFKVTEAPIASPSKEQWRVLLPEREDVLVEDLSAFRDHLVIYERRGGLRQIRISAPDGLSRVRYVDFPESVYSIGIAENPEFNTRALRFFYSSMVTPMQTVDYDTRTGAWEVKKQQEIPSGYEPSDYVTSRSCAQSPDGTQVPVSLVHRKGLRLDGKNPLLLEGYGAYGTTSEPEFDSRMVSLLERGFVYAIAHIRGGSEMGRAWYEQGRLLNKRNGFDDFIACAERLVGLGYTSPDGMAILGESAGGLVVTAAACQRPDLFKAVVAVVPFTNVISAMLKPALPLTVIEYEQWGHPDDPLAFEYMLSYSPYDNIAAKPFPHMLVKAGLNDLQVPYWDPAKWVAKLRAHKTDKNRLLLVTNMEAGHGGSSGRYEHLREDAQVFAFLIDTLGVREDDSGQG
jgi:oligopeptidase B